ncbi:hypothetical protein DIU31_024920 [Mucilaginibacter rubeus]|uniref:Uncharacterized protein n=1 Tax=Mucilaginibacter rubeus TaxID=2027860 RepID=A0AAE6JIV9_9SPHI|nr:MULTISPECIES: hypothetical protein [Mucilaginibacter]QEM06594.1 hypothetical protein DIU31_024920 [Mucilaginibacter rubeus]QEM19183.1 hypothetical protein DIU38_025185 [Mucilaginibacter gossypii]QTE44275.1 hypothetical protein J3L19_02535 [Mucilaginibacter rubeus]QTE50875.1 hypothetical protein J3L21_02510 [Mucilaginibacter rubeus]QTE55957.1 hypothetical protein J3L23_27745 [Mucilaginibacter rubeus]
MKELDDDELQELLNNGLVPDNKTLSEEDKNNLLAYQNLFAALSTEPAEGLPMSFAANVRRKLLEQANRKSDLRFNLLALGIFAGGLTLAYGMLSLFSPESGDMFLNAIISFKWILLTLVAGFVGYLFIDQRLVKRSF